MPSPLEQALADCEALLQQERRDGASEALMAAKDAAVERLATALSQAAKPMELDEAMTARLQSLLAANRFSLKWSHLRMKLGQIGQPKAKAPTAPGPRIDLVH